MKTHDQSVGNLREDQSKANQKECRIRFQYACFGIQSSGEHQTDVERDWPQWNHDVRSLHSASVSVDIEPRKRNALTDGVFRPLMPPASAKRILFAALHSDEPTMSHPLSTRSSTLSNGTFDQRISSVRVSTSVHFLSPYFPRSQAKSL